MALVLAVGGVTDFLRESVVGVLENTHHRRVDANVQGFQTIDIARGIQEAIDGLGVGALRRGETSDGTIGFGHHANGVRRVIDEY